MMSKALKHINSSRNNSCLVLVLIALLCITCDESKVSQNSTENNKAFSGLEDYSDATDNTTNVIVDETPPSEQPPYQQCTNSAEDTFQYSMGKSAYARSIAVTTHGTIIVVGYAANNLGFDRWIVRRKFADSDIWETVDDYQFTLGMPAQAASIAIDSDGRIYVSGNVRDVGSGLYGQGINYWVTRKSTDQGTSWSTIDVFSFAGSQLSQAFDIAIDKDNRVYVSGRGVDFPTSPYAHWLVRRTNDEGQTWTTVDDFSAPNRINYVFSISAASNGDIYATGTINTGLLSPPFVDRWLVRGSIDNGVSWSTIDDYLYLDNEAAGALAQFEHAQGGLYIVGLGGTSAGTGTHWLVRRTVDTGQNWVMSDDFQLVNGKASYPMAAAGQSISGYGYDSTNKSFGIVRKQYAVDTWKSIDQFQLFSGQNTEYRAMAEANNLYVAGNASDGTSRHWIVRKITCND